MGVTQEIAVQPSESDNAEFSWRVSVAEVNSGAPFSAFPGIDRHIALLDGAGFLMTLDGERTHALDTPFKPFAFAGESTVAVALINGATRDFNLMVRRAEASGAVVALREPGVHPLDPASVLVYVARGELETRDGKLQAGDALLVAGSHSQTVRLREASVALVVHIMARG